MTDMDDGEQLDHGLNSTPESSASDDVSGRLSPPLSVDIVTTSIVIPKGPKTKFVVSYCIMFKYLSN